MLKVKTLGIASSGGIRGRFHIELFGADGKLKEERYVENTITQLGDVQVADQMSHQADAAIGFMGIGSTTGGKTTASTGLENSEARVALDSTTQGAGAADNDVVYVATFAAGVGTAAIVEAGILRDDDNTKLMCYADFAVVNKGAADSMVITWTLTFGAS